MRGNHEDKWCTIPDIGSIPAYAGEPCFAAALTAVRKVYPRVCGGTPRSMGPTTPAKGLSPRMRGNRGCGNGVGLASRSIPAYAGEPIDHLAHVDAARVYPRVCGGTPYLLATPAAVRGLSPRMRGNHLAGVDFGGGGGSIPAYAGEPRQFRTVHRDCGVYPRVCGGTWSLPRACSCPSGLSPRMRGNRQALADGQATAGSIPAYAGEPITDESADPFAGGLSPRMRGNQWQPYPPGMYEGSIPAYAGEPKKNPPPPKTTTVYPRVCGGTPH